MTAPSLRCLGLRVLLPLLLAVLVLPACRDGTGPAGALDIRFTASPSAPWVDGYDGPRIECSVDVTARATGFGDAEWTDVQFHIASGADREAFEHAGSLGARDVADAWGSPRIGGGQTRHSTWTVWAGLPYTARLDFGYRAGRGGSTTRGTVEFECGPRPEAGAAAPTIRDIVVSPAGTLEIGGESVLAVSFTVDSPGGLWATMVAVEGGFSALEVEAGAFERNATRTVRIPVPEGSTPGRQIWIDVGVADIAGRIVESAGIAGPILVDRTPPEIVWAALRSSELNPGRLEGRFAVPDTLFIEVTARDNHRLAHLVYEIGPPANVRDSVAFQPWAWSSSEVELPIPSGWAGAEWLRLLVRDATGLSSPTLTTEPGNFHIHRHRDSRVQTADLGGRALRDVAHDFGRDVGYLAMDDDADIRRVMLDPLRVEVVATLPRNPSSLDVSPDGTLLLAAMDGARELALVDLTGAGSPRLVPLSAAGDGSPLAVRFAATGRAMVLVGSLQRTRLVEFDPTDGSERVRWDRHTGPVYGQAMVRSGDGSRIAFRIPSDACEAFVYDASTDAFSECRWLEGQGALSAAGDGSRFVQGTVAYGPALAPIWRHPFTSAPTGLSADGRELLIVGAKGLTRTPIDPGRAGERLSFPRFLDGVTVATADGRRVAVIGRSHEPPWENRVAVVDLD